jgi:predicted ribosomally synthesized peptide with SipW-like signal peptide
MKSIFLSVVVICALAIAGIGGTLAGWSDTEEAADNAIVTGSLDLKVKGPEVGDVFTDDMPWGLGINGILSIDEMQPDDVHEFTVTLRNDGQSKDQFGDTDPDYLYMMFKDLDCDNVNPIHGGYEDTYHTTPITQLEKPEPELVAEYGGWLAQVAIVGPAQSDPNFVLHPFMVPPNIPTRDAIGQKGDDCCLSTALYMEIWQDGSTQLYSGPIGSFYAGSPYLVNGEFEGDQFILGNLNPCGNTTTLKFKFWLPQNQFRDSGWPADHWPEKFQDWRINAYMVDKIEFNVMFELLDHEYVAPD